MSQYVANHALPHSSVWVAQSSHVASGQSARYGAGVSTQGLGASGAVLLDPPEPAATGALALPFVGASAMSVLVPSLEAVLPVLAALGLALPGVLWVPLFVPEPVD
jgi:hypothetical protein